MLDVPGVDLKDYFRMKNDVKYELPLALVSKIRQ